MQLIKTTIIIMMMGLISLSLCAQNQPKEATITQEEALQLVKPFYDFLGGKGKAADVKPAYHKDWKSYYSNTGSRTMDETLGFVSGPLAQMVPDLNWEIKEIYITAQHQIIVRGEATGIPVGEQFMGSPLAGGKPFTIMSIDIHELRDGKIARTYHVEDWLNAIQQVASGQ